MLPYPHEALPELRMSLRDFHTEARRILREDEHPLRLSFVNFVLAGRHWDHGVERRVTIDVEKDTDHLEDIPELAMTRDYNSMIGISTNLPYAVAISVYPVPNFRESLYRSNHLTTTIHRPEWQYARRVSLHLIPHFCIAKSGLRNKTLLFFPKMYNPGARTKLSQDQLATIYNLCIRPSITTILGAHVAHWPLDYKAGLMSARDKRSQLHFSSHEIPPDLLPDFSTMLRERLAEYEEFQDSFFLHEFRGLKGGTVHDPADDNAVDDALEMVCESLDLAQLGDPPNLESWWLDVAVEISAQGRVIQWREDAHAELVKYMLPSITPEQVRKVLKSHAYHPDISTLLYDLAGFRAEVPSIGKADNICYLNVYTTDKSPTYQLHSGAFRRHRSSDILPDQLPGLLSDVEVLGMLYQKCSGRGVNGVVQEGAARVEVRARMLPGTMTNILRSMEMEMVDRTMVAYQAKDWWRFKRWRLIALKFVFQSLERSSPQLRVLGPSLSLGAVAVWMLNSLIYRPGEQRWDMVVVPGSTAHETGEEDRGVAVMDRGETVLLYPDYEGDSDDEQEVIGIDQLEELIEQGDAVPMMEVRGCYFVSAVECREQALLCPFTGELDHHAYAVIYNKKSFAELEVSFLQSHMKKLRKEDPQLKRNRPKPVIELRRTSPERDIPFGLSGAGVGDILHPLLTGPVVVTVGPRDLGQGTLDAQVNMIWRQFLRDILRVTPCMKQGGSYCTLTREEIEAATEMDYCGTTLPFKRVIVKAASMETWDGLFFDRFFPPRAKCITEQSQSKPKQHFGGCAWWLKWNLLAVTMDSDEWSAVRDALRSEFRKLTWMPWSQTDRIWHATSTWSGNVVRLPSDWKGPALHIAVNEAAGKSIYSMTLRDVE